MVGGWNWVTSCPVVGYSVSSVELMNSTTKVPCHEVLVLNSLFCFFTFFSNVSFIMYNYLMFLIF
jgi:hypothetical protein